METATIIESASSMPDEPAAQSEKGPPDDFLISSMLGGDARALSELMRRYDRLVRYTIFRASKYQCARDPAWLDGLASSVWSGFVESARRGGKAYPTSITTFLVTVARNQTVSALRKVVRSRERQPAGVEGPDLERAAEGPDPSVMLQNVEFLGCLRECVREMDSDDRMLMGELPAIMDRRWRDAAGALGRSESTLRSQWKRLLERLRERFAARTGLDLAPRGEEGDL